MTRIDDGAGTRREFLWRMAAGAAALLAGPAGLARGGDVAAPGPAVLSGRAATSRPAVLSGRAALGSTGLTTSFVAQGTGSGGWDQSSQQVRLGERDFERLIRHGMERGLDFLDTADLYGSHAPVRKVLAALPPGSGTLLTKLWPEPSSWCRPSGGARPEIDRFRRELGVERLDIVLIHCATTSNWATRYARVRDELAALKSEGVIRAVGVSCHDLGALQAAAGDPWTEVILARINHRGGTGWSMDASSDVVADVLRRARGNGKAVIGMKLFGAGRMTKPADREASLRWVFEQDLVDAVTIGATKPEQIDENLAMITRTRC
jgi:aryl-alcohol dehydrogenase-like predicted oxidoreductase